jgi:hypothetical protein
VRVVGLSDGDRVPPSEVSRIVGSSCTSPEKLGAEPFGFQVDAIHAKRSRSGRRNAGIASGLLLVQFSNDGPAEQF